MIKYALSVFAALAVVIHGEGFAFAQESENPSQWSVRCSQTACDLYADVKLQNGVIFNSFTFRKLNQNLYAGIVKVPLGIHIPSGVRIGIDDAAVIETKVIACDRTGCETVFNADAHVVNFFKAGLKMSVVMINARDRKPIAVNYSLMGFTRTWNEFEQRMNILMP